MYVGQRMVRGTPFGNYARGLGSVDAAGNVIADENANMISPTFGLTVAPLAPYQSSINAKQIHDDIFGVAQIGTPGQPGYYAAIPGRFDAYNSGVNTSEAMYSTFKAAVAAGIVPNTAQGLETLFGVIGDGPTKAPKDFWAWYEMYLTKGTYNGTPAGQPGAAGPPTFLNPVTGQAIPLSLLAPGFPKVVNGVHTITLTDGRSWTFQLDPATGKPISMTPGAVAPTSGPGAKFDVDMILGDDIMPGGGYKELAERTQRYYANGTAIWGQWGRPESIQKANGAMGYNVTPAEVTAYFQKIGAGSIRVRFWHELDPAEQASLSWTGAANPVDALPPTPIPIPPNGSVIHVPDPASGQEPTIQLPGTTAFVPISSVPQQVWVDASAAAAQGTPPGQIVGAGAPSDGGTFVAGFGSGLGGLLAIGAIVGIMIAASKKKG